MKNALLILRTGAFLLFTGLTGIYAQHIQLQPGTGGKTIVQPNATDTAFSITENATIRFTPGTGKLLIGASGSDYELPNTRGTNGQVLTYNGTLNTAEWQSTAAAVTGTANAFALFDASGNFNGTSGPLWDDSFKKIILGTAGAPSVSGYSGLSLSSGTGSQIQLTALGIVASTPSATPFSLASGTPLEAMDSSYLRGGVRVGSLGNAFWYKLPGTRGGNGDVLYSNGSGGTYWSVAPASVSLSGTDGQLVYKTGAAAINTATGLTWDNANSRLGIGTPTPTHALEVTGNTKLTGSVLTTGIVTFNGAGAEAFSLPATKGTNAQVLSSDGAGGTTWSDFVGVPVGTPDRLSFYNATGQTLTSNANMAYNTPLHRLELGPNVAALTTGDGGEYLRIDGNAGINGSITMPTTGSIVFGGVGTAAANTSVYGTAIGNVIARGDNGVTLQALGNSGGGISLLSNMTGSFIDMQANSGSVFITAPNISLTTASGKFQKGSGLSAISLISQGINLYPAGGDSVSVGDRSGALYYNLPKQRGSDGQILSLSGANLVWSNLPAADNLGNHTATQNLDLGSFKLVGQGGSQGLTVTNTGIVNMPSDVAITGMLTIAAGTAGEYYLPVTEGNNGEVLTSQGGGVVSWQNPPAGTTLAPFAGAVGEVTYRTATSGEITSSSVFTVDEANEEITLGNFGGVPVNIALNGGGKFSFGSLSTNTEISGDGTGLYLNATAGLARIALNYGTGGAVQIGGGGNSYDLPTTRGNNGEILTSDGAGGTIWTAAPSGADNLGNHMAIQNLDLGTFKLVGNGGTNGLSIDNTGSGDIPFLHVSGSGVPSFRVSNGSSLFGSDAQFDGLVIAQGGIWVDGSALQINANNALASYTLPNLRGTNGQVLTTDGTGGTSWAAPAMTFSGVDNYITYQSTTNTLTTTGIYYDNVNARMGLGNSAPEAPLHVTASANTPGAGSYGILQNSGATNGAGSYPFTMIAIRADGTIRASEFIAVSDQRYKKNIALLPNALAHVMQLRGVSYEMRTEEFPNNGFSAGKQLGLIAQEVEAVYPELVTTDTEGYKAVNYNGLIPVLLEAIKEQQHIIEAQSGTIETLEASQSSVQTQLFELKQQLDQLTRLMETATTSAKQD